MRLKTVYIVFASVLASVGGSAFAAVEVSSTPFGFAAPADTSVLVDFDSPLPGGFTLSGGLVRNSDDGLGAEPAVSTGIKETSYYLAANPGNPAVLTSTQGFRSVSLYWGSIDAYNTLMLLDAQGDTIAAFTGSQIGAPADGDQFAGATNRRVTFTTTGATPAIAGLEFQSSEPAFEVDKIAFAVPVPEPAGWTMLLAGFALTGGLLRRPVTRPARCRPR